MMTLAQGGLAEAPNLSTFHSAEMMPKRPDISVIMPCFNCSLTLKRAVNSVLEQPGVNVEIILVDDASTDSGATRGVISDILGSFFANAKSVLRPENGRIAASLNSGAMYATGRYIMRLDSDDWLERGCLARMLAALEANPKVGFVYGQRKYYGRRSDTYIPQLFKREQFDRHNAAGYAYLFRREALDKGVQWRSLGTFNGAVIDMEDYDHLHQLLALGYEGLAMPDTLVLHYTFRWDGTWQELKANQAEALKVFKSRWPSVVAESL